MFYHRESAQVSAIHGECIGGSCSLESFVVMFYHRESAQVSAIHDECIRNGELPNDSTLS